MDLCFKINGGHNFYVFMYIFRAYIYILISPQPSITTFSATLCMITHRWMEGTVSIELNGAVFSYTTCFSEVNPIVFSTDYSQRSAHRICSLCLFIK